MGKGQKDRKPKDQSCKNSEDPQIGPQRCSTRIEGNTVRFEMPFNVWCLSCRVHIGMGVRYNAAKTKVDKYYTTDIFQFTMRCRLCGNTIVIRTDPKNFDYSIVKGIAKQAENRVDPDNSLEVLDDKDKSDIMYKLEREVEDRRKSQEQRPMLERLRVWRSTLKDDFGCNSIVRSQFRARRKELEQTKSQTRKLQKKASLKIPLLPPDSEVRRLARSFCRESQSQCLEKSERKLKLNILKSSVLAKTEESKH